MSSLHNVALMAALSIFTGLGSTGCVADASGADEAADEATNGDATEASGTEAALENTGASRAAICGLGGTYAYASLIDPLIPPFAGLFPLASITYAGLFPATALIYGAVPFDGCF
jgi:hypothetical protein